MNEETFARLLQQREDETLDFKQELPGSSDLAVLISAFYNTRGGKIIIGVNDEREPIGLARPQSVESGIVNIIRDRLDLDVPPAIEIVTYHGKEFVVVTCPRGPYPPYFEGIDYWEYPREAMREALLNAVIHRDYSITGGRIRIFMFDDRIEFYSPGDLLPGITVEKMQRLESQSKLRNPTIVEVFRDLGGYIEKMGTGIQRITHAMEEHGLPKPPFDELGGEFRVTLVGPGEHFMTEKPLPTSVQELNKRQVQLLQFVEKQERITRREYEKLVGISDRVAKQDIQILVSRGFLVRRGASSGTYYVANLSSFSQGKLE